MFPYYHSGLCLIAALPQDSRSLISRQAATSQLKVKVTSRTSSDPELKSASRRHLPAAWHDVVGACLNAAELAYAVCDIEKGATCKVLLPEVDHFILSQYVQRLSAARWLKYWSHGQQVLRR